LTIFPFFLAFAEDPYHSLDNHGTRVSERLAQNAFSIRRPLNGKSRGATGPREGSEIDRLRFDSVFRFGFHDELFPLDLTKEIVPDDNNLNRKFVLGQETAAPML
jgi:hypothetical protein